MAAAAAAAFRPTRNIFSSTGLRLAQAAIGVAKRRPFLCSGLSSGTLMLGTDIGIQHVSKGPEEAWDKRRSLSMFSWGLIWYGGPQQWLWVVAYPAMFGRGTILRAAATCLWDSIPNMLFFYIPTFYMWTGLVKGKSIQESYAQLKKEYLSTFTGMAAFWIPVQFLNFWLVPPHLQTYVVSSVNILNKSWLSWTSNDKRPVSLLDSLSDVKETLQVEDFVGSPVVVAGAATL